MQAKLHSPLIKRALSLALTAILGLGVAACAPTFSPTIPDTGWDTSYEDALSPHTQLALSVMKTLTSSPDAIPAGNRTDIANRWQKLADLVGAKAQPADISAARRDVEAALGDAVVTKAKAGKYTRADLMAFMMSSGMKIPAGGMSSLNPDHVAATKTVDALRGKASTQKPFEFHAVAPDEALSPLENLTLGTVLLLEKERDTFVMPQVFRLALYFRPIRRLHDPNAELVKINDPRIETVYLDRIWRVLNPDQVKRIREMNLSRTDMEKYLARHGKLEGLDWHKHPTFALLEYAVNDFHEQIAPPVTIAAKDKPDFYIPPSLKAISGKKPGDGQKLFEGICASCHGVDGQGRFPPVVMPSYLSLHSDHEHFEIVKSGPPQKLGSPIVMPTFEDKLTKDQIWAIVKHIRTFEKKWQAKSIDRRNEAQAKAAGVKFYGTPQAYERWKSKDNHIVFLDLQSDIAYRIMGHIPNSLHIRPEELDAKMKTLPKDKELLVLDMFGSQGLAPAIALAKAGYKVGYLDRGMEDWHIERNYPVSHD